MTETSDQSRQRRESTTSTRGSTLPGRICGGAFVVGAVLLVADFVFDSVFVGAGVYEGPAALLTVILDPLWIPSRVVYTGRMIVLAIGLSYLLVLLYRRGERSVVGPAGAVLALSVVLFLLEFVVAAVAAPSLFGRPRGIGLSQEQVQLLLMGYQSLGIGLLAVAFVLFGASVTLVGVALSRTRLTRPAYALGGVVVGGLLMLNGVDHLFPLPVGGPVGLVAFGVVVLWFLAFGARLLGSPALAGAAE